jgi:cysteine desulfurase
MFPRLHRPKKNIYLDFAATTPVDAEVVKAMAPFWSKYFGNPSSLYKQGREAREAIEESRKTIAHIIGARPQEIIFTAGGTESCNLAVFGVARNNKNSLKKKYHLITSSIEHYCVLNSFQALIGEGYKTSIINVDDRGFVKLNKLKAAVKPETLLISIMLANNEIGTIEPVMEIGKWLKNINAEREQKGLTKILLHTDACQAAGFLDLNVGALGVDLMSVNGSKIYGPKQTGFLFVRNGLNLKPMVYGGGQERGLRSGTENVPGIVGLAKAMEIAAAGTKLGNLEIGKLQKYFISKLIKIPGVKLNGPEADGQKRLVNNINITVQGVEGEALMLYLDSYGIAVSTGSACSTGSSDPSHVLLAIGCSENDSRGSIRLTLGKTTTKSELDYVLKILPPVIGELKKTNCLVSDNF